MKRLFDRLRALVARKEQQAAKLKKYRQLVIDLSLKIKKLEGDKRLLKQILKKSTKN